VSFVLHFPGRISLGFGLGEAMNEVPLGFDWPDTKGQIGKNYGDNSIIRLQIVVVFSLALLILVLDRCSTVLILVSIFAILLPSLLLSVLLF
jgi:hypothetical protein